MTLYFQNWVKYIPFIIVGLAFLYAVYKIMTTDHLLSFLKKSLCEENGKPSGKSISGFACINSMLIGFFISIYYAKDHTPPDWYVYALATLIGSFYGMKEIGKFAKPGNGTTEVFQSQSEPPKEKPVQKPVPQKQTPGTVDKSHQINEEEIG